ncbi:MAG: N-acetylmuramoyl-L-alanine amidase [Ruminococcus flavefaciens]|nr:N-acetylmuramoyl-L-alanine amidase [Ruminococcus flavefaciens]
MLTAAVLVTAALRLSRPSPAEVEERLPDYVIRDLLTVNEWSRPGEPLKKVSGIVLHYVGNPGTTAQANRNYFESLSSGELQTYASSHFIVGLEGEVLQCVPMTEIAYASNTRNADTVSIEVCHPDGEGEYSPVTYAKVVELTAWLCQEFRLDPEEDVIRHYDVTGKLCPLYYVDHPEAWDALRADVAAEIRAQEAAETGG